MLARNAGNVPRVEMRESPKIPLDRRFVSRPLAVCHATDTERGLSTAQGAG
jgi:hypothetical protein